MIKFIKYQKKLMILAIVVLLSLLNAVHARNVAYCQDLDDHREIQVQVPHLQRHLQTIVNPHGLRIKFLQPPADPLVNSSQINHMFSITSLFFKQLLKVTDVSDSTRYTSSFSCGTISTTSIYATTGFSYGEADMVVSTQVEYNSSVSYVAYASACSIRTWVQYGYIGFNTYYFSTDPSRTSRFQDNLLTLLHEMTHILGMSPWIFSGNFRRAYLNPNKIPSCQAVTTYGSRSFITTPNVQAWVQQHYGCDQSSVGALLEEEGSSGSAGSHWERATTLDDYMTASVYHGSKVTPITLHLLKDSGFYYDVDFSLAQGIEFGKNRGCAFARGLLTSSQVSPQYCTGNVTADGFPRPLDFYNFFGGYCGTASFSSGLTVVRPYLNFLCYDSANSVYSPSTLNTFGAMSRSFLANQSQWTGIHCFQAVCDASKNNVQIKINGVVGTCVRGGSSTIIISGTTVYCPKNFDIFCSRQNCPNHCGSQGYCSHGSCLSTILCSSIDSNCVRCKGNTCTGCASGLFPTGGSNPVCNTCSNILPSCLNGCEVTQEGVTVCKQIKNLSPIIGTCNSCIAVLYCSTCTLNTNGTNCLTCSNDPNGNPRYPTADKQSCKVCGQFIANCITCTVTSGNAVCSSCNSGLIPLNSGSQCGPNPIVCGISFCQTCNNPGAANQVCTSCTKNANNQNLYPNANGNTCQTCRQFISGCTTCTVSGGNAVCSSCSSGLYPTTNGNVCQDCGAFISGCTACTVSGGNAVCSSCSSGLYPTTNGDICQDCSSFITNCTTCTVTGGNAVCSDCDSGLYPTTNGDICQDCSSFIANCTTCTVTGGNAVCSICASPLVPLNSGTQCGIQCLSGQYAYDNSCYECPITCSPCQVTQIISNGFSITCL